MESNQLTHHAIAKSILCSMTCRKNVQDFQDGRAYVPMPLLYQVRWLCPTFFKMRLYNSITFVFFSNDIS